MVNLRISFERDFSLMKKKELILDCSDAYRPSWKGEEHQREALRRMRFWAYIKESQRFDHNGNLHRATIRYSVVLSRSESLSYTALFITHSQLGCSPGSIQTPPATPTCPQHSSHIADLRIVKSQTNFMAINAVDSMSSLKAKLLFLPVYSQCTASEIGLGSLDRGIPDKKPLEKKATG